MESLYDKTTMQQLYHRLMRTALLEVVEGSVEWVAKHGIPTDSKGIHVTFDPYAKDVVVPDYLKEQFPEGMSVILQHQYGDLKCDIDSFAVTLIFDGDPTRIIIPWESLTGYVDEASEFAIDLIEYSDEDNEVPTHKDNVVKLFPKGNDQNGDDA